MEKPLLGIESPYLWALFKPISFSWKKFKKFDARNSILSNLAESVEGFCGNSFIFVKTCEKSILTINFLYNSILLNKFSL